MMRQRLPRSDPERMGLLFLVSLAFAALACGGQVPQVQTPTAADGGPAQQVETATTSPLGSVRSQPAPLGSTVQLGDISLKVEDVLRPADAVIAQGSIFNPTPAVGEQYVLVKVSVTCEKSSDESCAVLGIEFNLVGSSGVAHPFRPFLGGVEDLYEGGEFFGGSTKSGFLAFRVPQEEENLVLKYEKIFLGEVCLSIEA